MVMDKLLTMIKNNFQATLLSEALDKIQVIFKPKEKYWCQVLQIRIHLEKVIHIYPKVMEKTKEIL